MTITGAAAKIGGISALFDDMDAAENRAKIQEHFGTLKSSADLLASASLNVAAPVAGYHSSTVEVGEGIKTAMTTFAWAVGLLVTGAIVGAIFSFGGSLAVAGGGVALAVEDTIATIRGLYTTKRLFQILKITLAASVAVGVIDAFGKVPDLTATLTKLAAIIAMKALIDDNSPTAAPALGGNDPITQEIAKKIAEHANGRAAQGDGSHYVPGVGAAELPEYVRKVLDGEVPTEVKHLPRGRTAYWDPEKGAVVIEDGDGGTVFTPKDGREYFDGL
ncbi:hypothetical protein OG874_29695 [Nocardia sp. NBC_00565]|uniref:hypothetical protein n=1 Tax=Nocardia sp. NBC_00565 TaxID=2975993 RepID=UPI002E81120F|nr:hypothetical protein [Nocardia sp. NBC_00565]WUC00984.1 hypothetical protein OG874_29695 [Nocardia sp. NBC_00565]